MKMFPSTCWKSAALALGASCVLMAQGPVGRPGFGFGPGLRLEGLTGKTITGAPFSATRTTQFLQTLANGTQIQRQEQANVYRDGEGRVRIEATISRPTPSGAQSMTEITIHDPVAGYSYRLNPQKMTGVQAAIRQRAAQSGGRVPRNDSQVQTQSLGTQTINGVSATGTQVTRIIPAGTVGNTQAIQIVRVTWISNALQTPVQITVTDPRSGTETMNLTNVVSSEPSSSLFVVPSGYSVTTARAAGPRGSLN
jgi:hypothetical protein